MEIVVAMLQVIIEVLLEIILMIFHFFVGRVPRLTILLLLGIAIFLLVKGVLIAAALFAGIACIVFWRYIWRSSK